jgi:ABC-2 type transport system permease protein
MIIRPFLYDFKRTITSKTVLILVAIVLLISLAIIPLTSLRSTGGSALPHSPVLYYLDGVSPNLRYHYLTYFTNQYGDGISGVTVTVTFQGPTNHTSVIITNSSGLAFVTVNAPNASYSVAIKEELSGNSFSIGLPDPSSSPNTGGVVTHIATLGYGGGGLGQASIQTVVDKRNSSKMNIQVFYAAKYGAVPSSYTLYYKVLPVNNGIFCKGTGNCPFNETQMIPIGNLNSYLQIFDPSIPTGLNATADVWFELFDPNGIAVGSNDFSAFELRQPRQPIVSTSIASFFFSGVLGFFIPLMTIIGSYSSYGKDRLTGVLESVLARPVTKRGLAMSRFLSTVLSFTLASAAAVGVVDLLLNSAGGSFLDQSYVLAIIAGLAVEVAAFTGLIFLLSHLLKSTGALLGISIVLFLVLDFFWSLIIFVLTLLLGGTSGSAVALQATFLSYYANPAQFLALINVYILETSSGFLLTPSNYGVTLPAIILDGILWAVLPFLAFLYLAIKRD